MTTDRELLELAAKAAGQEVWFDNQGRCCEMGYSVEWNPLKDDGDALRLAVKLGITPVQYKDDNVCAAYWTDVHCCHAGYKSDPYEATRRAITRAAAEIQREKEAT